MLIGIDASRANRPHKSGTEWYSYYLIRWLAKFDSENQYILYTDKPLSGGLLDLTTDQYIEPDNSIADHKFSEDGFQIINSHHNNFRGKILNWPFNYLWTQGRLSLEMILRSPDILFVPAHALPIFHPVKSVVTIHDIGFIHNLKLYSQDKIGPDARPARKILNFLVRLFTLGKYEANALDYLKWSTKYALDHADKIITVSNFSKHEIIEYYNTDEKKIDVVHNGFNKFLFRRISDKEKIKKVLSSYGVYDNYFLYVGRIEKKKNTPALIEAYAIARENDKNIKQKLVLVGDASFGYDETNYMIKEYGLDNDVIMLGWVEETDLPYFFNGADAYLYPSKYEGFGIPLLQAMACGVPIAASFGSSIPEVAGNAALFFDPYDSQSIAKVIVRIANDSLLREKLIARGLERIKNFSWEITAKNTLEILNKYKKTR